MKRGLLVIKSNGEPDKLVFADADTVKTKFRATDKEAVLYACVRIREKRAEVAPAPVAKQPEPIQPKKGKV